MMSTFLRTGDVVDTEDRVYTRMSSSADGFSSSAGVPEPEGVGNRRRLAFCDSESDSRSSSLCRLASDGGRFKSSKIFLTLSCCSAHCLRVSGDELGEYSAPLMKRIRPSRISSAAGEPQRFRKLIAISAGRAGKTAPR